MCKLIFLLSKLVIIAHTLFFCHGWCIIFLCSSLSLIFWIWFLHSSINSRNTRPYRDESYCNFITFFNRVIYFCPSSDPFRPLLFSFFSVNCIWSWMIDGMWLGNCRNWEEIETGTWQSLGFWNAGSHPWNRCVSTSAVENAHSLS